MNRKQPVNWFDSTFRSRWTPASLGAGLLLVATIGCGPAPAFDRATAPVASEPIPPAVDATPAPLLDPAPGQHIRTGGGTAVDINPPGGGIHVNVPPGPNGSGAHVDVGPGGVNVQSPNTAN